MTEVEVAADANGACLRGHRPDSCARNLRGRVGKISVEMSDEQNIDSRFSINSIFCESVLISFGALSGARTWMGCGSNVITATQTELRARSRQPF